MPTLQNNSLFLREVSEKKLRRLVQLSTSDPFPLIDAAEDGVFNIIREKAKSLIKIEQTRVNSNVRTHLQKVIEILNDNAYPKIN